MIRWKIWKRWLRIRLASTTRRDVFTFSLETAICMVAFLVIAAWCFRV